MNRSMPGLPVHHQLPEFTQTHVHRFSDAIQPSHPLSSPSPPAPNSSQHQSLFQWVNSLHEVAKVLEFLHLLLLNCLQFNIILRPMWLILAWYILLPFIPSEAQTFLLISPELLRPLSLSLGLCSHLAGKRVSPASGEFSWCNVFFLPGNVVHGRMEGLRWETLALGQAGVAGSVRGVLHWGALFSPFGEHLAHWWEV